MALSQPLAPLSILCSARNNANFLLLLLLPTPPPLNILLKRYKIPCATCVCVPYLLLFTSMTNEIIRAPAPRTTYAVAQMPLAGMRATATQIYFTSPKMLCTLCRWAIFYFLRSCSLLCVCFFSVFACATCRCIFIPSSSIPVDIVNPKNNIYILRCNLCTYLIHYAWVRCAFSVVAIVALVGISPNISDS